uniref:Thrombospondin-like N-terminal domain-containing protein n=1 Tax=Oryzias latipes TaxID=8090 RepID=H2M3G7_ORYLA
MVSYFLRWAPFIWIATCVSRTLEMAVSERADGSCPPLSVEDYRFSDVLDRPLDITGFDLTEKFLDRKGTVLEDMPSFRLGSAPLIKPTKQIFPNELPSEYSLAAVMRVRRTTKKDRWYFWQIFDQSGDSQVSVVVDGGKKVVELSFQDLQKNTLRYTFKSRDLHALFDRQWHRLGISLQSNIVSVYVDCKLTERRLIEERISMDSSGRTLITTRIEDGRPVDIEMKQILLYCDPYMAEMENCCELIESKCGMKRSFNGTSPPPVTAQIPLMLSQPASQSMDRCPCPDEKGDSGLPGVSVLPNGNKGDKGELGSEGQKGIDGEKGDVGPNGTLGLLNPKCLKGEKGEPGQPGQPGKEGKRGRRGKPGEPGPRSLPGPSGTSGGASVKVSFQT